MASLACYALGSIMFPRRHGARDDRPTVVSFRMTTEMQRRLGYDEHGTNPTLLADGDLRQIEAGNYPRAGGQVVCSCGATYDLHPKVQGALWLTRTCDAGIVKL